MKRVCVTLLALGFALVVQLVPAAHAVQADAPVPVTISELTRRSFDGNGQLVVFTGEAIGEPLRAPGGKVWVNVLGGSAIGVVADRSMADEVGTWGDYHNAGDTVHVTGTFNVACDEHGGDMDVHATALKVIDAGFPRAHPVDLRKGLIGLAGLVVAVLAVLRGRRIRAEQEGT